MPTNPPQSVPAIIAVQNLLARMLHAAKRAGDVGHEFIIRGVYDLNGLEIKFRREVAGEARLVEGDLNGAAQEMADGLANDGVLDRAECARVEPALWDAIFYREAFLGELVGELAVSGQRDAAARLWRWLSRDAAPVQPELVLQGATAEFSAGSARGSAPAEPWYQRGQFA